MDVRILHRGDQVNQYYEVSGVVIALRLIHELTAHIWDTAASALSATTTMENSGISMTEKDRMWTVAIPNTLPYGRYIAQKYLQSGASLAVTDELLGKEYLDIVP